MFLLWCSVWFTTVMVFGAVVKKLHALIRPQNLLPLSLEVVHLPYGKHPARCTIIFIRGFFFATLANTRATVVIGLRSPISDISSLIVYKLSAGLPQLCASHKEFLRSACSRQTVWSSWESPFSNFFSFLRKSSHRFFGG